MFFWYVYHTRWYCDNDKLTIYCAKRYCRINLSGRYCSIITQPCSSWTTHRVLSFSGRDLTALRAFFRTQTHLGVVGRLLDDLGRHPERRADEGVALDLRVRQLPRNAEVGQLHLALLGQQHVGGCRRGDRELYLKRKCPCEPPLPPFGRRPPTFDVSVDLLLRVQVLQAFEDLPQDGGDLRLVQSSGLHLYGVTSRCERAAPPLEALFV